MQKKYEWSEFGRFEICQRRMMCRNIHCLEDLLSSELLFITACGFSLLSLSISIQAMDDVLFRTCVLCILGINHCRRDEGEG